jgi:phosphoenolpyruvate-protein kinase (PTS system EI component)
METGYERRMMAQLGFDTLAFVKRLAASGMATGQAEALAEALSTHVFPDVATKSDLNELRAELKADLRELELRLSHSLTLRFGVMIGAPAALTVAILGMLGAP